MLGVLSIRYFNHFIPFIYASFFKMCYPPRKIATINQLIKIENSRINYSEENNIVLTLGYNLKENIAPFVMFTTKFFSKFRKNWYCLHFFYQWIFFLLLLSNSKFLHFKYFPHPPRVIVKVTMTISHYHIPSPNRRNRSNPTLLESQLKVSVWYNFSG